MTLIVAMDFRQMTACKNKQTNKTVVPAILMLPSEHHFCPLPQEPFPLQIEMMSRLKLSHLVSSLQAASGYILVLEVKRIRP